MLPAQSYTIVLITTMSLMGLFGVFMIVFGILVRYTEFIKKNTGRFVTETLLVSIISAIPLYIAAYNRDTRVKIVTIQFVLLASKIALFWLLMELSGVNSVLFPSKQPPSPSTHPPSCPQRRP